MLMLKCCVQMRDRLLFPWLLQILWQDVSQKEIDAKKKKYDETQRVRNAVQGLLTLIIRNHLNMTASWRR